MKKIIYVVSALLFPAITYAAPQTCADKKQQVEQELNYAKQHQQTHRVHGLEQALANLNTNCTDDGLKKEHQSKIDEKQHKLDKAQAELQKAIDDKKSSAKIQQKKQKVEKAQSALDALKAE